MMGIEIMQWEFKVTQDGNKMYNMGICIVMMGIAIHNGDSH